MTLRHVMTEYVICFVVSGGNFVSVVDLEEGNDEIILLLNSEVTSERLFFNVRPDIAYYKIYPNCSLDVIFSEVEELSAYYTIVSSECPGEETEGELEEWGVYHELFKGAKHIPSADDLTIEENQ